MADILFEDGPTHSQVTRLAKQLCYIYVVVALKIITFITLHLLIFVIGWLSG